jgi:hypothetical protein
MGVAPKAIVEKNSGIDSRIPAACLIFPRYHLHKQKVSFPFFFYLSSGARPALPIGVDPEAMVGFLRNDHRLNFFFDLYSTVFSWYA